MKKSKLIYVLFAALVLSGCEGYQAGGPFAEKPAGYTGGSMCQHMRPMQIEYAPQEYMQIPTCPMDEMFVPLDDLELAKIDGLYEPVAYVNEDEVRAVEPIKTLSQKEEPWDVNPNDIEGDFPDVEDNKHNKNQVIMQNLETRVLAFCRGTQEMIDACVGQLGYMGFEKITNVPRVTAKYDLVPNKGYPARRWREGESVPRW